MNGAGKLKTSLYINTEHQNHHHLSTLSFDFQHEIITSCIYKLGQLLAGDRRCEVGRHGQIGTQILR